MVIGCLRHHASNADVQKQGLSLLFYILSDDMQSKFHLEDVQNKYSKKEGVKKRKEKAQIRVGKKNKRELIISISEIIWMEFKSKQLSDEKIASQ